ncbi:2-phospho-L-lactate guanylyltransferase [Nocardioides agariphilus]|jgi:2-phospho-L-lactate guanylyltransferase|uniref:2-phospho-L-lactate guanylyltransferase n=1 Tax=Nocardioides agariphilus TaxID=433664 RepID=A0A930VP82_9ACTN|nr:2-phospho-L-lactate guanylyltransferase [Nocardioides agariphilus]MBF4770297.1 2-phospho-L-lactate guanylyltransferase [Nocardioides agariphilus]
MSTPTDATYVALVPVKPPGRGKTRLGDLPRDELAAAFALDTVSACLAARSIAQVLVVTDDAAFASRLGELGCTAIPDGVSGDLNASLSLAAMETGRRWPQLVPVALCADLPCLLADDLDAALAQRTGWPRFVADAKGDGSTLYTAPPEEFAPQFGRLSAARHADAGAWSIEGSLAGLRHDVDDAADLRTAIGLGLGAYTSGVVERL